MTKFVTATEMLTIHKPLNFALRTFPSRQNVMTIIANNFCNQKLEKADELKLSYLTGEGQKGIAVVELNREVGKNSLSKSLVTKLHDAFDVLSHDKSVRAVIIR